MNINITPMDVLDPTTIPLNGSSLVDVRGERQSLAALWQQRREEIDPRALPLVPAPESHEPAREAPGEERSGRTDDIVARAIGLC